MKNYSFIFDFDSTVITKESLDEVLLSSICDNDEKITPLDQEQNKKELKKPDEVIVKEPTQTCPSSCEDNNECTVNSCSAETDYKCSYSPIIPCCGDNSCDQEEDCNSCATDCGECLTVANLKQEINSILGKENYLWKIQEDPIKPFVTYHAFFRNRVVIAEITDSNKKMQSYNDFLDFDYAYNYSRQGQVFNNTKFMDESQWDYVNITQLQI